MCPDGCFWPHQVFALIWGTILLAWGITWWNKPFVRYLSLIPAASFYFTWLYEAIYGW